MADRTSAQLFSDIFIMLSNFHDLPQERIREIAEQVYRMVNAYDFNDCQMGCDVALIKLGLATKDKEGIIHYRDD